jgi:hypothetical protein
MDTPCGPFGPAWASLIVLPDLPVSTSEILSLETCPTSPSSTQVCVRPGQAVAGTNPKSPKSGVTYSEIERVFGFDLRDSPRTLSGSREPLHSNGTGRDRVTLSGGLALPRVFARLRSRFWPCSFPIYCPVLVRPTGIYGGDQSEESARRWWSFP